MAEDHASRAPTNDLARKLGSLPLSLRKPFHVVEVRDNTNRDVAEEDGRGRPSSRSVVYDREVELRIGAATLDCFVPRPNEPLGDFRKGEVVTAVLSLLTGKRSVRLGEASEGFHPLRFRSGKAKAGRAWRREVRGTLVGLPDNTLGLRGFVLRVRHKGVPFEILVSDAEEEILSQPLGTGLICEGRLDAYRVA